MKCLQAPEGEVVGAKEHDIPWRGAFTTLKIWWMFLGVIFPKAMDAWRCPPIYRSVLRGDCPEEWPPHPRYRQGSSLTARPSLHVLTPDTYICGVLSRWNPKLFTPGGQTSVLFTKFFLILILQVTRCKYCYNISVAILAIFRLDLEFLCYDLEEQWTVYHLAASEENFEILAGEFLEILSHVWDHTTVLDKRGRTPLGECVLFCLK